MSENYKSHEALLTAIETGNSEDAHTHFESILAGKVSSALDAHKVSVAQKRFNEGVHEETLKEKKIRAGNSNATRVMSFADLEAKLDAAISMDGRHIWPDTTDEKYQDGDKINRKLWKSDIAKLAKLTGGKALSSIVALPPDLGLTENLEEAKIKRNLKVTFKYKETPDVVVSKEFEGKDEKDLTKNFNKWKKLALDIAGKNEHGDLPTKVDVETVK